MKFRAYVLIEKQFSDFEVMSKIRVDVRGHVVYMLCGLTECGNKANAAVNKSQWDAFDVPIVEKSISKKTDRKRKRNGSMQPLVGRKTPVPKGQKRAYNEEIEQWLANQYGIDLNRLDADNKQQYFDGKPEE